MSAREQRKLAAIVAADVVGYSRLMGRDEAGTVARLRRVRAERLSPILARRGGRTVKLTGDGALIEFGSAVEALSAAIEFQQTMAEVNRDQPEDARIVFRIGLHLGDLIVDGDDLYGDGVNVAARLEAVAPAGGIIVSRTVHEAVAGRLQAMFDDLGNLALKNIDRPVQAFAVKWQSADWGAGVNGASIEVASPTIEGPLALPDKPSIAVLPFQNMSGDPDQEYFVDGLVEDIITGLSRFKSLFVIARNSSFAYKGKSPDVRQVGRELGVRYVLEGSVRKGGGQLRITGQLIEADTGAHLWADRYDGALENVFSLQDRITESVIGAIAPKLDQAEIERAKRKPVESLDAHDHYLRGLSDFRLQTQQATDNALKHFLKAVELDPTYGAAYGMAAWCHHRRRIWGWTSDRTQEAEATESLARLAVMHGKDDPISLATAGFSIAHLDDVQAGITLIERACALNPSHAMAWWMSALARTWLGESETGIEHARRAIRLNPLDPQLHQMQLAMGNAHFVSGRYEEAEAIALDALKVEPNFLPALRLAAATCALLGHHQQAGRLMVRLRESFPHLRLSALGGMIPFKRPQDVAAYVEGLRLAGLPE